LSDFKELIHRTLINWPGESQILDLGLALARFEPQGLLPHR
jgi:hypothetical protein